MFHYCGKFYPDLYCIFPSWMCPFISGCWWQNFNILRQKYFVLTGFRVYFNQIPANFYDVDMTTEYILYRGRDEVGGVDLPSQLERTLQHGGKCSERGWACTPHHHQPGLIFPSWCNVRQKVAIATLCVLCGPDNQDLGFAQRETPIIYDLVCVIDVKFIYIFILLHSRYLIK